MKVKEYIKYLYIIFCDIVRLRRKQAIPGAEGKG